MFPRTTHRSTVSVAFIRVCMGIFNNSFFGNITWIKELKYIHTGGQSGGQSGSFEESIGKYCFAIVTGRDKIVVNNEGKLSVAPLKMENNEFWIYRGSRSGFTNEPLCPPVWMYLTFVPSFGRVFNCLVAHFSQSRLIMADLKVNISHSKVADRSRKRPTLFE
jgi:hypothetical protein